VIEQAIYARLSADAAVTALVGTRVYPVVAPQKTAKPFIVYRRIDTEHANSKTRGRTTDSARALVEVQAIASTYSGARALAEKVRLSLQNYSGAVSIAGGGTVNIGGIISQGEADEPEMPSDMSDEPRHKISQDFACWFNEASPT
jgi:hypothetical protein